MNPLESLFALTSHKGLRLAPEVVQSQPVAVFFGFTRCPDVCPTTLLDWSNALEGLGADGDRLKVMFVSVDSERDTPETLQAYMASFDPRILALTGGTADIARAARAFDAYYERVASAGGSFTFDHSTKVYLVDRDGRLSGSVGYRIPRRTTGAGSLRSCWRTTERRTAVSAAWHRAPVQALLRPDGAGRPKPVRATGRQPPPRRCVRR